MSGARVFVITDCGSTTTKALLIERRDGVFRQTFRGEAPTTVEAPVEDVTVGVRRALRELGERCGRRFVEDDGALRRPATETDGMDAYLSTSSAGGGLQMVVAGVARRLSADSAMRAALSAGAIVTDSIACDDGHSAFEQIDRLRRMRPDMILLSGGTDGGHRRGVVQLAELIAAAMPRPRLGDNVRLPVIFAGNRDVADEVTRILSPIADVLVEANVRPSVEQEAVDGARDRIHELFLEHVMRQAPGFAGLMDMTDADIMPTPSAVGHMLQLISARDRCNVLCVDIGGATTDVFSVVDGRFNRTVSANLGMSYSAANVLAETGVSNIARWVDVPEGQLLNEILNKTVRPTTIPETPQELAIEQALAREALRLAFAQHREFSIGMKGGVTERAIDGGFSKGMAEAVSPARLDLIIGSGGVLSHAPDALQTAAMVVDAFAPEGLTRIARDSIFMLPHLGVLSRENEQAAMDVFERDCIAELCLCVAPTGAMKRGTALSFLLRGGPGECRGSVRAGELLRVALPPGETVALEVVPAGRLDAGAGPGRTVTRTLRAGQLGVIFDCRGRPFVPRRADAWRALPVRDAW